jgi:vacuolar-type H+-ATPase subunit H
MSTASGRVNKSKVQEFVPAGDGLEGELVAFINSLIDQNAELAAKLENIDSLMELAEKIVIEAGKEAEGIKLEAEREANARVAAIVAEAADKAKAAAQKIVAKAQEKSEAEARRIIAEARQKAEDSAQGRLSLAEQQAQEIMKVAEERGSWIIAEAREKAEQLLASKKMREQLAGRDSQDVPGKLSWEPVVAQETEAMPMEQENPPESPVLEPAVAASKEEGEKKESCASYDDTVELVLPPPTALDQLLKLHKHLKNSRVKVTGLKGSLGKGIRIKLLVQSNTGLKSMLAALPEVEKVADEPIEDGKAFSAHGKGNVRCPITIAVTMKR